MFAMLYAKQLMFCNVKVFFHAFIFSVSTVNIQGYQTPFTDYLALQSNCCLATTEGDSLSLFYLFTSNFIRKMPNNNENTINVKKSSVACTCSGTTSVTPENIIQKLMSWDDPENYKSSLELMFNAFIDNDLSDSRETRREVLYHHTSLIDMLNQLSLLYKQQS